MMPTAQITKEVSSDEDYNKEKHEESKMARFKKYFEIFFFKFLNL